ncbi:MAG: enterochelin esterase, partial [Acidobacteria bacterium]|nr:enterochelin esterase [Acidobacteriota bacterium]
MPTAIQEFKRTGDFSKEAIDQFLADRSFPHVEGNQITFVYRGYVDKILLQHWIFGLESGEEFERLGESDLWFRTLEIPDNSRVEYKFWVEKDGKRKLINDPLNPHLARDPFGANSVCHTTGYALPDWANEDPETRPGSLHELTVPHTALGSAKTVQLYLPARFRKTRRYPLLIVHDGFDYMKFAALKTILDNMIHRGELAPLIAVLTQSDDRLKEYAGYQPHAQFIAEDLVPLIEGKLPLRARPDSRCLMGASFGGVASLSTAWYYPGMFGRLLLQSG